MNNYSIYLFETENGILINKSEDYTNKNFEFTTWSDLLDIALFYEIDHIDFYTNGIRLKKVLNFLKNHLNFNYNINQFNFEMLSFKDNEHIKSGSYAMITGVYPEEYNKNILKHIFIDKVEDISFITVNLLLNSDINLVIVINHSSLDAVNIPTILFSKKTYLTIEKYKFFSIEELEKKINDFNQNYRIEGYNFRGIIDFGKNTGICKMNSLFIYDDGVYADLSRNILLSDDKCIDFQMLINKWSLKIKGTQISKEKIMLYNAIATILDTLSVEEGYVINSENTLFYDETYEWQNDSNLIGVVSEGNNYILDISKRKIFQVSISWIIILEAYLKNLSYTNELSKFKIDNNTFDEIYQKLHHYTLDGDVI